MTLPESAVRCPPPENRLAAPEEIGHSPAVPDAMSLRALNAADAAGFTRALGAVFERSPWVAQRAWARRPYATVRDLHAAMVLAVRQASAEEQIALLQAHPDLAGRAARLGAMSDSSVAEQASAGLDRLTADEYDRFHRLNTAYRERFGFPFIIAVRHHDTIGILDAFARRLGHTREQEIETALAQVGEIAWLRLQAQVRAP
jgi:2-oxo-4-hydroxy-4-carboxy-5-ureidoimidazoline decarboxylase